jgi:hypothetical protein
MPNKEQATEVKVLNTTSGNKYRVEYKTPDGQTWQGTMTAAQIANAGGSVPEQFARAKELHQVGIEQGYRARETRKEEFADIDAARKLAVQENMTEKAALETIKRFKKNPQSEEFDLNMAGGTLTPAQKEWLGKITGIDVNITRERQAGIKAGKITQVNLHHGLSENIEYVPSTEANRIKKENPELYQVLLHQGIAAYNQRAKQSKQNTVITVTETKSPDNNKTKFIIRGNIVSQNKDGMTVKFIPSGSKSGSLLHVDKHTYDKYTAWDENIQLLKEKEIAKLENNGSVKINVSAAFHAMSAVRAERILKAVGVSQSNIDRVKRKIATGKAFSDVSVFTLAPGNRIPMDKVETQEPLRWQRYNDPSDKITDSQRAALSGPEFDRYVLTRDAAKELLSDPKAYLTLAYIPAILSPTPVDEVLIYFLLSLGAVATVKGAYDVIKIVKSNQGQTGQSGVTSNTYAVTENNNVVPLPQILRDLPLEQLVPPKTAQTTLEQIPPGKQETASTQLTPPKLKQIQESIKKSDIKNLVMITPSTKPEEITGEVGGVIRASAAVEVAQDEVKTLLEKVIMPDEVGKYLPQKANENTTAVALPKAYTDLVNSLQKRREQTEAIRSFLRKDEEFRRKLQYLEEAKKQFVASLNPQPLGKASYNTEAVAAAYMAQLLNIPSDKVGNIDTVLDSTTVKNLIDDYEQAYKEAIQTGQTVKQAEKTATEVLLKQLTKVLQKQATKAKTSTRALSATTATTATTSTTATTATKAKAVTSLTKVKIPPPPPPSNDSSEKWTKKEIRSAVAWKQGIGYWAIKAPYKSKDDARFFAKPPKGMKVSANAKTAFETIQTITGSAPGKLRIDMGIQDITIRRPSGVGRRGSISFTRDTKQKTTGDLRLGHKAGSKRRGRYYYTKTRGGTLVSNRPL